MEKKAFRYPALLLSLLLLFSALSGCEIAPQPGETPPAAPVESADPVESVTRKTLSDMGLYLTVPAGAKDISYSLIDGEIGQVEFYLQERIFTFRVGEGEDVSGVYEEMQETLTTSLLDYDILSTALTVRSTASGGALADWNFDRLSYYLFTPDNMSQAEMSAAAESLANTIYLLLYSAAAPDASATNLKTFITRLNLYVDAPKGAEEVSYEINDGSIAIVHFTLEERNYEFRAAHHPHIAAVSSDFLHEEYVDMETDYFEGRITLKTDDSGAAMAVWEDGKTNYCLYIDKNADPIRLLHLVMTLSSELNERYLDMHQ